MRLRDKVAIVTGGGTGIGRATALLFAREGAKVMLAGRRPEPLAETVREIRATGKEARWMSCDVSKSADVQRLVDNVIGAFGKIDILYNNAAVFVGLGKTVIELTEDEWDAVMDVNLKGVFLCCKYVIPHLISNRAGAIINCSSISGHVGQRRQGAYNAAKGGVELLTKCMALDFAPYGIRVNAVCPGWVEIDLNREDIRRLGDEIARMHPIGRAGQPEDVAKAVLYLASDESSWVTGTSLLVDGGYTAQ